MPDFGAALTRKVGPLPVYAWGAIIGGGVVVAKMVTGSGGGSGSSGTVLGSGGGQSTVVPAGGGGASDPGANVTPTAPIPTPGTIGSGLDPSSWWNFLLTIPGAVIRNPSPGVPASGSTPAMPAIPGTISLPNMITLPTLDPNTGGFLNPPTIVPPFNLPNPTPTPPTIIPPSIPTPSAPPIPISGTVTPPTTPTPLQRIATVRGSFVTYSSNAQGVLVKSAPYNSSFGARVSAPIQRRTAYGMATFVEVLNGVFKGRFLHVSDPAVKIQ